MVARRARRRGNASRRIRWLARRDAELDHGCRETLWAVACGERIPREIANPFRSREMGNERDSRASPRGESGLGERGGGRGVGRTRRAPLFQTGRNAHRPLFSKGSMHVLDSFAGPFPPDPAARPPGQIESRRVGAEARSQGVRRRDASFRGANGSVAVLRRLLLLPSSTEPSNAP